MFKTLEDAQNFGKEHLDLIAASVGNAQKSAQAITTELSDYSKNSFEQGSSTVERLFSVKTLDKAIEIHNDFARSSYEGVVALWTRLGGLCTDFAKELAKPGEAFVAKAHGK